MTDTPKITPASDEKMLTLLESDARVGLDGSPADPVAVWALARIRELEERSGCEHCSDRRRQAEADLATARARIRELEAENKQLKSRLSTIDN